MAGLRAIRLALLLLIGATMASTVGMAQEATPARTIAFTSPAGDFEFRYPSWMIDCEHQSDQVWRPNDSCMANIPVCSAMSCESNGTIACIAYPKGRAGKTTNLEGAAFTVNIVKEAGGEKACLTIPEPPAYGNLSQVIINGTNFAVRQVDGAGMSHGLDGKVYRVFRNNTCYEPDTRVTSVAPEIFDQRPKEFEDEAVRNALNQVLDSFRFTK